MLRQRGKLFTIIVLQSLMLTPFHCIWDPWIKFEMFSSTFIQSYKYSRKIAKSTYMGVRVSNRNSVAHYVAEHNAIFTAISTRFVAHIPHPFAPNLRLKVSFLAHQQCGILGAIKV